MPTLLRFLADERAATSIEYGVIAVSISILIVTALTGIGGKMNTQWLGPLSAGFN